MRCAICLDEHARVSKSVAIKCGHVFCDACLQEHIKSQSNRTERVECPTCRRSFKYESHVFRVFLQDQADEDKSKDEQRVWSRARPFTTQEEEVATEIVEIASALGLETPHEELQGFVSKAEKWSLDLAPDAEAKKLVLDVEESLRKLRERLVFSKRLSGLKQEVNRLTAEQEKLRTLSTKYKTVKQERDRAIRKFDSAKARLREYTNKEAELLERETATLLEAQELEKRLKLETERLTARAFATKANENNLIKEIEELKNERDEQKLKAAKWRKKYLAEKDDHQRSQARAGCSTSEKRSEEIDDSLEIVYSSHQVKQKPRRALAEQQDTFRRTREEDLEDSDIEITESPQTKVLSRTASRIGKRRHESIEPEVRKKVART